MNKMKTLFPLLTLLFFSFSLMAQVGINTPAPDPKSVLDLKSNNKGLLIPRMTTTQREAMSLGSGFVQGMMVYDTDLDILFVGYGNGALGNTKWYAMNPWKTEHRTDNNASTAHMTTMTAGSIKHGNIGIGTAVPTEKLHVAGQVKATGFKGFGIVPVGGIIMWKGSVASIPSGWKLCNGSNGTPDLRNRFVVGAGSSYSVNARGGANSVTVYTSNMPSHSHANNSSYAVYTGASSSGTYKMPKKIKNVTWSYSYGQLVNMGSTKPTGGGAALENRPPYYALAYIMRTN